MISIVRYAWFHGIGRLGTIISAFPGEEMAAAVPYRFKLREPFEIISKTGEQPCRNVTTFLI